jgi:hypothetical protein
MDRARPAAPLAFLGPAGLAATFTITLAIAVAACGEPASSGAVQSVGASPPAATPDDVATPTVDPNAPGQSEVEGWGAIWDALAPSYPVFEGAEPADPEAGPVSAAYTVPNVTAAPRDIAQFYLDALDEAGYGTLLDGPLEDGSFTVWSSNGAGCDSLVTVLPRGEESLITVLFGAGCAFV